ncbi:zinc ribbon-containing protein, partial [Escherichia sp. R-CC3]
EEIESKVQLHWDEKRTFEVTEVDELTRAVRRDLEEFAMSYEESLKEESDSVFMRVIKESLWQELADIT